MPDFLDDAILFLSKMFLFSKGKLLFFNKM